MRRIDRLPIRFKKRPVVRDLNVAVPAQGVVEVWIDSGISENGKGLVQVVWR